MTARGAMVWFGDVLLRRWVLLLIALVLGQEVLTWYGARMVDGSDEPLGLLALVAAVVLAPHRGWTESVSINRAACSLLCLALFALGSSPMANWPILFRALIWVAAIPALIAPRGRLLAWGMLGVLSLPWLASMQFFLGYPLRVAISAVAAAGLRLVGLGVHADGTVLMAAGERVLIDAPCSGLQMGWTLTFLATVLANTFRFGGWETWRLLRWASLLVFAANTLRAMVLFVLEIRLHVSGEGIHNAVGLACFAAAGLGLLEVARKTQPIQPQAKTVVLEKSGSGLTAKMSHVTRPRVRSLAWIAICAAAVAGFVLAAQLSHGLSPSSRPAESSGPAGAGFPGWASSPLPSGCDSIELSERDARFVRGFPGQIAAFSDGEKKFLVRWVSAPTRKLHSSSDCLRGSGFAITAGPARRDVSGQLWSTFLAERGSERLHVEERISDTRGPTAWTDVSAWYWSALLQKSKGPWWAVTIISPVS